MPVRSQEGTHRRWCAPCLQQAAPSMHCWCPASTPYRSSLQHFPCADNNAHLAHAAAHQVRSSSLPARMSQQGTQNMLRMPLGLCPSNMSPSGTRYMKFCCTASMVRWPSIAEHSPGTWPQSQEHPARTQAHLSSGLALDSESGMY